MWYYAINKLKNEKAVIGYEIINEPAGIDMWKHPLKFWIPGY